MTSCEVFRIYIRYMVNLSRCSYCFNAVSICWLSASCVRAGLVFGLSTVAGTPLANLQEP